MSRERFKALMGVLHVVDPNTENPQEKLRKVSSFIQASKDKCQCLYQPYQQIAIDERMVKSLSQPVSCPIGSSAFGPLNPKIALRSLTVKTNLHQLDYFQDNRTPYLLMSPNLCQVQKQRPGRSNSYQLQGYG